MRFHPRTLSLLILGLFVVLFLQGCIGGVAYRSNHFPYDTGRPPNGLNLSIVTSDGFQIGKKGENGTNFQFLLFETGSYAAPLLDHRMKIEIDHPQYDVQWRSRDHVDIWIWSEKAPRKHFVIRRSADGDYRFWVGTQH
ncbi:MAG: hypothetical protein AAGA58_05410 [Verrucomicrobiota bacterium]